jgi:hypothetical protein
MAMETHIKMGLEPIIYIYYNQWTTLEYLVLFSEHLGLKPQKWKLNENEFNLKTMGS